MFEYLGSPRLLRAAIIPRASTHAPGFRVPLEKGGASFHISHVHMRKKKGRHFKNRTFFLHE